MKTTKVTREFPDSSIGLAHQTGAQLGDRSQGVGVTLHTRKGEQVPRCAEVYDIKTGGNAHYAELGLVFDGTTLIDFDGAFTLPTEVKATLRENGFTVDLG